MQSAFIIAEYNPFHNGHRYHIEQTRKLSGADAVVAVMSGNFVQRGDIAIGDKFLRAEAAVLCGADLVVELPVKYAVSNASAFADGAIQTVCAFGVGGTLSFGASATLSELRQAIEATGDLQIRKKVDELSRTKGKTFPAAIDAVLRESGKETIAGILNDPNNVLGMEYLKSLSRMRGLRPLVVERIAEHGHDSDTVINGFTSAGNVRSQIYNLYNGDRELYKLNNSAVMPDEAFLLLRDASDCGRFPSDRTKYNVSAYSRLLIMTAKDFVGIENVSHGLENRIVQAVKNNASLEDAIAEIKSKRYTMARVRQILTASVLNVTRQDVVSPPSYLRVLAFNETGRKLLSELRDTVTVPLVTNLSDAANDPACCRDASLEYAADKLFDLCLPKPRGGNRPFLDHSVYIKNSASA